MLDKKLHEELKEYDESCDSEQVAELAAAGATVVITGGNVTPSTGNVPGLSSIGAGSNGTHLFY